MKTSGFNAFFPVTMREEVSFAHPGQNPARFNAPNTTTGFTEINKRIDEEVFQTPENKSNSQKPLDQEYNQNLIIKPENIKQPKKGSRPTGMPPGLGFTQQIDTEENSSLIKSNEEMRNPVPTKNHPPGLGITEVLEGQNQIKLQKKPPENNKQIVNVKPEDMNPLAAEMFKNDKNLTSKQPVEEVNWGGNPKIKTTKQINSKKQEHKDKTKNSTQKKENQHQLNVENYREKKNDQKEIKAGTSHPTKEQKQENKIPEVVNQPKETEKKFQKIQEQTSNHIISTNDSTNNSQIDRESVKPKSKSILKNNMFRYIAPTTTEAIPTQIIESSQISQAQVQAITIKVQTDVKKRLEKKSEQLNQGPTAIIIEDLKEENDDEQPEQHDNKEEKCELTKKQLKKQRQKQKKLALFAAQQPQKEEEKESLGVTINSSKEQIKTEKKETINPENIEQNKKNKKKKKKNKNKNEQGNNDKKNNIANDIHDYALNEPLAEGVIFHGVEDL